MIRNVFYVYEHWRPDTGVCFYVGKGKKQRAWMMRGRNRSHRAVQSKLLALGMSVDVRIVLGGLSEESAFVVERDRIALYGRHTLTNRTDGGEGSTGLIFTVEAKQKMREAAKRRPPITNEFRAKMSAITKGRIYTPEVIETYRAAAKKRGIARVTREAQKKAVTGRPRKPHTAESKELMRIAARKRKLDAETRAKISATLKGRRLPEITRAKMSAAQKARQVVLRASKEAA